MLALGFELPAVALRSAGSSSAPTPFSPTQFAPTAMFDPANTAQLYQDDAGVTAVTTDNQPVGLWRDETANGLDLSQEVSAARPSYRTDGTLHWVEMDGVDDSMDTAAMLRIGNPITMVLGYQMLSTVGTGRVSFAEISHLQRNSLSIGSRPSLDRLQYMSRMEDQGVSMSHLFAGAGLGGYAKRVVTVQAVPGNVVIRMDGIEVLSASQNLTTEFMEPYPLRIGRGNSSASFPGAFRLFGLQVWSSSAAQPSLSQIEQLEGWMADRIGVTL